MCSLFFSMQSPGYELRISDWSSDVGSFRSAAIRRVDGPTRVYFGPELDKLDVECRGFLLVLEQHGILDPAQRELVLDRAMALDQDELDLDDLKWVVLMVLFNQRSEEHTSELQSLMRISYAVFCLKKKQ